MVTVERTKNVAIINKILRDTDLKETAEDDEHKLSDIDYETSVNELYYLLVKFDDEPAGIVLYRQVGEQTYEVHYNILKKYRNDVSKKAVKLSEQWMKENTDVEILTAKIAILYPSVIEFAVRNGCDIVGIREKEFKKNNKSFDLYLLAKEM